jgi:hypothetical protein
MSRRQNAGQNHNNYKIKSNLKCGSVQIFWNGSVQIFWNGSVQIKISDKIFSGDSCRFGAEVQHFGDHLKG